MISHIYDMVPSLLPNQLIISLTCQVPRPKQMLTLQDPPSVGFVPQIQSTALQDKALIGSDNQEMSSSEVDQSHMYITII